SSPSRNAQSTAQVFLIEKYLNGIRQSPYISSRDSKAGFAMDRNLRHARVNVSVDDRESGSHGFQLNQPECFCASYRRQYEHTCSGKIRSQVVDALQKGY